MTSRNDLETLLLVVDRVSLRCIVDTLTWEEDDPCWTVRSGRRYDGTFRRVQQTRRGHPHTSPRTGVLDRTDFGRFGTKTEVRLGDCLF